MIRIEMDDTGVIRDCSAFGDSFEIAAQICGTVCNLYHVLSQVDKDIAEQFRFAIMHLTQDNAKSVGYLHAAEDRFRLLLLCGTTEL